MRVRVAQLVVGTKIEENQNKLLGIIDSSKQDEWVIFPECFLSGYYPEDESFLKKLDSDEINSAISLIHEKVKEKEINCIFGTALFEKGKWYNTAVFLGHSGQKEIYKKANLATLDRKHFAFGNSLDVFEMDKIKFGIQICRDNAFPGQWNVLKQKGAQIIFHINNATKENDINRKAVLITRAFENQYFVASVNNASKPQTLPSLIISPFGEIQYESTPQKEEIFTTNIDLSEVKTDYLNQERKDLVEVVYKR